MISDEGKGKEDVEGVQRRTTSQQFGLLNAKGVFYIDEGG